MIDVATSYCNVLRFSVSVNSAFNWSQWANLLSNFRISFHHISVKYGDFVVTGLKVWVTCLWVTRLCGSHACVGHTLVWVTRLCGSHACVGHTLEWVTSLSGSHA